jgi:predicted regulator of Ras-like GTPase activity (Roadblock/LC7/MglB family)
VKLLSKSTTTESKFRSILKSFRARTGITYTSIINEDGLIIVVDQASLNDDDDFDQSLGAISASILAFAQNGIAMLNELHDVKSLIIQAGYEIENESFKIIIESIGQDVSLMIIFPTSLNVSLILFELKQITQKLLGIINSEEQSEINAKISSTI